MIFYFLLLSLGYTPGKKIIIPQKYSLQAYAGLFLKSFPCSQAEGLVRASLRAEETICGPWKIPGTAQILPSSGWCQRPVPQYESQAEEQVGGRMLLRAKIRHCLLSNYTQEPWGGSGRRKCILQTCWRSCLSKGWREGTLSGKQCGKRDTSFGTG